MLGRLLFACTTMLCLLVSNVSVAKPSIVIILDDLGYKTTDLNALSLPSEITFSILPETPLAKMIAEKAERQGRAVMLHMPMQAESGETMGPLGLTTDMYPAAITHTLRKAIKSIPNVVGVNNHMGSAFTGQEASMTALMQEIKRQGLFFIDSRTSVYTTAQQVAQQVGVPNASRHVFLDHVRTTPFIAAQFERMKRIAQREGSVVVIAHPHQVTLNFLQQHLPLLQDEGFTLTSASDYLMEKVTPVPDNLPDMAIAAPNE